MLIKTRVLYVNDVNLKAQIYIYIYIFISLSLYD